MPTRTLIAVFALFSALVSAQSPLKPDAQGFLRVLPEDLSWNNGTAMQAIVIAGDPNKPGIYVVLQKWLPHKNSRPHFHANDRFITVLSGTWWVNTGPKYDPEGFKPVPAGSFVTHFKNEIHYDGAKDAECLLQIVGIGPATSMPAETK